MLSDQPIAINLNPYQGLKPDKLAPRSICYSIAINLNPYQGLKHQHMERRISERPDRDQLKSLSGIET